MLSTRKRTLYCPIGLIRYYVTWLRLRDTTLAVAELVLYSVIAGHLVVILRRYRVAFDSVVI